MIIKAYFEEDLPSVAKALISEFGSIKVWCFYAEMGSGKTTLIKQICNELDVMDDTSSPTFSIINEYQSADRNSIFHFDFYRLKTIEEAIDIGVEEYFFSGSRCFCEWPELIEPLLPDDYLKIKINLVASNQRSLIANLNE